MMEEREESKERLVYEYAVIRYVPRVEREEFINVGLLMMCKRLKWIKAKIWLDPAKLAVFNCTHSVDEIRNQFSGFLKVASGDRSGGPMSELPVEERFRWLAAVKSACLATSRPHPGLTSDPEATFSHLFAEQVI